MQVMALERTKQSQSTETLLEILQIKDRLFLLFEHHDLCKSLSQLLKDTPGIQFNDDIIDFAL